MFVGLDEFCGQVWFVVDEGGNEVELDGLELDFGGSQVFAVFFDDGSEFLLGLSMGQKCFGFSAEQEVFFAKVVLSCDVKIKFFSQIDSFHKWSFFRMKIVLNKVKNNLRFVEAVGNDFDKNIFALIIEFWRELLYEECKKDHIVPRVGNIVL